MTTPTNPTPEHGGQEREPNPSARQIVFNWMMRDDLTKKEGWWGGYEDVERVDELIDALRPVLAESHPLPDAAKEPDTDVAMTHKELADSFNALFEPAPSESELTTDYSFFDSKPLPAPVEPAQTFEEWYKPDYWKWFFSTGAKPKDLGKAAWNAARQVAAPVEEGQQRRIIVLTSALRQAYGLIENGMEIRAKTLIGSVLDSMSTPTEEARKEKL